MASRLLKDLDLRIASATDPILADCLRAQRAGYLARQGHMQEARAAVDDLHLRYDRRNDVRVTVGINIAEGLILFFTDLSVAAVDKMRRAHALAKAANLGSLQALSSAWLAHLHFGLHDFERLTAYLREALALAGKDNHSVLSRASLVCAQSLHFSNQFDRSIPWYRSAQSHASSEGDDATISAHMFNMASMQFNLYRQSVHARGIANHGTMNLAAMTASSLSYDQLIGAVSLDALPQINRAQIYSLRDEVDAAIALYDQHLERGKRQGLSRTLVSLEADLAWCKLRKHDLTGARALAQSVESSLATTDSQIDEVAAAHSALARVYEGLGLADQAAVHAERARQAWEQFAAMQSRLAALIDDLDPVRDGHAD